MGKKDGETGEDACKVVASFAAEDESRGAQHVA